MKRLTLWCAVLLAVVGVVSGVAYAQDTSNPILNCATEVCCRAQSPQANAATIKIMTEQLGMKPDEAKMYAARMQKHGIVFFPAALSRAIGDFAFDRNTLVPKR